MTTFILLKYFQISEHITLVFVIYEVNFECDDVVRILHYDANLFLLQYSSLPCAP